MMKTVSNFRLESTNVGTLSSLWCSVAAWCVGGAKARGNLCLNALLNTQKASQGALGKLGGALMEVNESTLEQVTVLMAKVKFVRNCIVLKVRSLDVSLCIP